MMKLKALCFLALFSSANYAATHPVQIQKGEIINYSYKIFKDGAFILHGEQSVTSGESACFSVEDKGGAISHMSLCISSYDRNGFLYSNLSFLYSETVISSTNDMRKYQEFTLKRPLFLKSGEQRTLRTKDGKFTLLVSGWVSNL